MSLVAVKKPYLLKISLDEDAPDPRKDYDNLGSMVCWHRHYRLGDAHSYKDPGDFLQELVEKNVSDTELIRQAKAGKIPGVRLGYVRRERIWTVESYDTMSRKWIRLYGFDGPFSRCSSEADKMAGRPLGCRTGGLGVCRQKSYPCRIWEVRSGGNETG